MDRAYDGRLYVKVQQVGEDKWLCWNFHKWNEEPPKLLWNMMAIHWHQGGPFVKCWCTHFEKVGYPCSCSFDVFDDMHPVIVTPTH